MCILFIAVEQHPDYPLIIAANRDEFLNRPTRPSGFWQSHPDMLAGKDLQAGGTWMGMTKSGRISALTNVRDPQTIDPNAISRGELVTRFLTTDVNSTEYLETIRESKERYNGYNLLFGPWNNLMVYNNHQDSIHKLERGVYGLSNADLNSPWPKINKGMDALESYCQTPERVDIDHLFELLRDTTQAKDEFLPKTGVPIDWERRLSSIFIQSPEYGTRSSTVFLIDHSGRVFWEEHSYDNQGQCQDVKNFQFSLS